MRDLELQTLLRSVLLTGLASRNMTNVAIQQANQPTLQGANSTPSIYFFKVSNYPYGFLKREDIYDINTQIMSHIEKQDYETVYQIEALVTQDPANITGLTASDLVNMAYTIIQSDAGREMLGQNNVGILRTGTIRNPYARNDRDIFQASPSFDITLTHSDINTTASPVLTQIRPGIYGI